MPKPTKPTLPRYSPTRRAILRTIDELEVRIRSRQGEADYHLEYLEGIRRDVAEWEAQVAGLRDAVAALGGMDKAGLTVEGDEARPDAEGVRGPFSSTTGPR